MWKISFKLRATTNLIIHRGSILEFCHSNGAIVNAANEGCLGGGGVDGAITNAGGKLLHRARLELPIVNYHPTSKEPIRCRTGTAKITGPFHLTKDSDYHICVPYVIHAVGPNYFACTSIKEGDELLRSVYLECLVRCKEAQLHAIAFSLISAGVYRGPRSVAEVLQIGIDTIKKFIDEEDESSCELEEVHMYAFTSEEMDTLLSIARDIGLQEEHVPTNV